MYPPLIDCTLVSVAQTEIAGGRGIRRPPTGASQQLDHFEQDAPVTRDAIVDLIAAMLAAHAPLAEVFAIVREHAVAVFPEPLAGSADDFMLVEPVRSHDTNPDWSSLGKLFQGHFLDRPSAQSPRQSAVLHHPACTDVDSVMRVAATRSHHVRTERRLTRGIERAIARPQAAWRTVLDGVVPLVCHAACSLGFHRSLPSVM